MKNIINYLFILVLSINLSCNTDENQIVPNFLDGTKYGVLLDVDTSATEFTLSNVNSYKLTFKVSYKEGKRHVESIAINKTYTDSATKESSVTGLTIISQFPSTITLSSIELVKGFSKNISINDLKVGDSFKISFAINYKDGGVVDRFDSSMRTNFIIPVVK